MMITAETLRDRKGPIDGEGTLVRCAQFRCMAYRDRDGKWRDYFSNDTLPEPVEVIDTESMPFSA